MPFRVARSPGTVPLLFLFLLRASVALVDLPASSSAYFVLLCVATSPRAGSRMSRSAGAAGSAAGKSPTAAGGGAGGGGDQPQRFGDIGGHWGGFPMFGPGVFPGFHTLDRLYAEMMDNVERVRSEMERMYNPPFGRMSPYPALAPGAPPLRAGGTGMPLAVPVGGSRGATAGGSIMPYYRGGSGSLDVMSPFYSPLFGGEGAMMPFTRGAVAVVPRVDFLDAGDEYLVQADVPGLDKSNVKVHVQNGVLHISGEQHQETKEQQKGYFMQERFKTAFSRSLMLPENVREDDIRATIKDGVLQVHLPKISPEKTNLKKIHVE